MVSSLSESWRWTQRLVPPARVDLDAALRDLPGVPDPTVENRELALPVARRARHLAQLPRLRLRHGQPDRPNAPHLELQIARRGAPRRAERCRRSGAGEQCSQVITAGGHASVLLHRANFTGGRGSSPLAKLEATPTAEAIRRAAEQEERTAKRRRA